MQRHYCCEGAACQLLKTRQMEARKVRETSTALPNEGQRTGPVYGEASGSGDSKYATVRVKAGVKDVDGARGGDGRAAQVHGGGAE